MLPTSEAFRSWGSRRQSLGQTVSLGNGSHNALKRLNPGSEMVWARTPQTHNIWYTGVGLKGAAGSYVAKFSGLQTLEKSRNREIISTEANASRRRPTPTSP